MIHLLPACCFAVVYLACAAISYAGILAYWQREFPSIAAKDYDEDVRSSLFVSLAGPVSLAVVAGFTGWFRHGLKWR